MTKRLWMTVVVLAVAACDDYRALVFRSVEKVKANAVDCVRAELVAESRIGDLRASGNKWGEGIFVFAVPSRPTEHMPIWVWVRGEPYALENETAALTPNLLLLAQAPREIQDVARLQPVSVRRIANVLREAAALAARGETLS